MIATEVLKEFIIVEALTAGFTSVEVDRFIPKIAK